MKDDGPRLISPTEKIEITLDEEAMKVLVEIAVRIAKKRRDRERAAADAFQSPPEE